MKWGITMLMLKRKLTFLNIFVKEANASSLDVAEYYLLL